MKVRKAVFPVAGFGTRFFPATKVVPKELLPIVDKPVIQYLVEEAVQSGIEEILFVISRGKELIKSHFSPQPELEKLLTLRGKKEILEKIRPIHKLARFHYIYQKEPHGDGDAILYAEKWVGKDPFLILFGDDIVKHSVPAARQLLTRFSGESILAVQRIPKKELHAYGIIKPGSHKERLIEIKGLVEKPDPQKAPSHFGIIGKYVCPFTIFNAIRRAKKSHDGELRLIDGLMELGLSERLWAYEIEGKRFDTGRPEGLIAANEAFLGKQ